MIKSLYISYNAITEPIVQSQVIPYLRELSKNGIKFYLLTFEKTKIGYEKKHEREAVLKRAFQDGIGVEWRYLYYHKSPTVPATLFDIMLGCIYASYIIIRNRIKIVHARAIVAALIGYPTAKLLSRKFIYDTRGIDSEEYVDADLWRKGGAKHRLIGFFEDALIRSSDYVTVLTEKFLGILKKKYHNNKIKFSVIPCAVDTEKFQLGKKKNIELINRLGIQDKFVITYAGSLGTWYMLKEMLDFFKIAVKFIDNAHFLLLTQTDKNYAMNVIKQSGLDMKHITVDATTYDSMPDYLSVCNWGIFFIKPVFSKLSSSPVKFGEYLASGLPVIINYGIGDTEEIVRNKKVGAIVENFNESGYKKALEELLELLKDADLAQRCRKVAEEYLSLEAAVQRYAYVYRNLAGGGAV